MGKVLVLARHDEDVTWLRHVPSDWRCDIVQKDRDIAHNGREQSSYLWWILTHWDELPTIGTVCFSQAWPFDHMPTLDLLDVDHFTPLGKTAHLSDDLPEAFDEFVGYAWRQLFGPFPEGGVRFPMGSCFLVPASVIRCRPKSKYEELLDFVIQTPTFHAHVLERMWPWVFGAR